MDIRQIAAIGTIAMAGVGLYRVVKSSRELASTANELDKTMADNERKLEMLKKIDTLRAARVVQKPEPKSKFDNGRVIDGVVLKTA